MGLTEEIRDILDMWKAIESSYARLHESEKCNIRKDLDREPKFRGFDQRENDDPNREYKYYSEALEIIEEDENYEEFRDRYLNTHIKTLPNYQDMLEVYKNNKNNLTADILIAILEHNPTVPHKNSGEKQKWK